MRIVSTSSERCRVPASLVLAMIFMVSHGGAVPALAQSRGELLYDANCIACHNEKMHWRDGRQAKDWDGLERQVRRWQQAASLGWRDEDIVEVARYLNERFYGFTPTNTTGFLKSSAPSPSAAVLTRVAPPDRP